MELVIDANILFAALIKDSTTAKLITNSVFTLFAPTFLIKEFEKYKKEIIRKTRRSVKEFNAYYMLVSQRINLLEDDEIFSFLDEAKEISPDPGDISYFAVALAKNIAYWSNDAKLKNQTKIQIYTTKDIIDLIELN